MRLGADFRDSRWVKTCASALLHVLLLVGLVHSWRGWVAPMLLPGDEHGTRMMLAYLPGRAASSTNVSVKAAVVKPVPPTKLDRAPLPVKQAEVVPASANSSAAANPNAQAGDDAKGSGDVDIALVRFFPAPKPDLSKMPHGTSGEVVLDAVIDADGKIAKLTATKTLGYGIDEDVIATVQKWVFQPATKDGKPVASEQELHFHYERG